MTTIDTKQPAPINSPQKHHINWTLFGILTIAAPLIWCILFFIWYFVYDALFHPPKDESAYSWSGIFIVLAAIASGFFAVPIGIVIVVLGRRLSPGAAVARNILGVLALVVFVALAIFSVFLSQTWGGATLANRPALSSQQGYTALSSAIDAVMKVDGVSWDGEYKLEKYVSYDRACPWGNQFVPAFDRDVPNGTMHVTPDIFIQSASSALESIGWSVTTFDDDRGDEGTYRYVEGKKRDVGTVRVYITPENIVSIGVENTCFAN